ncbi:Fic family protein [Saccharothrix sp. Mg75]|uniref:Fic family protein n=1 Tax=Saccharothrix sp. Mg75 TaxID=3445357 RepID=UPI003EEE0FA5
MSAYAPYSLGVDVHLSTQAHGDLNWAEQAAARVDEAAQRLPDRRMFALCTRLREVQNSAHMSGVSRSLLETFLVELLLQRAEGIGESARDILAQYPTGRFLLASEHCMTLLREPDARLDMDLLGRGSALLTGSGPRSGMRGVRTHQGWLAGPQPERIYALTMPPGEGLLTALRQLSEWLNSPHPLSRVGRVALGHLHLELLQPFPESNGHLARLFDSLAMVKWKLLRDQVLLLSPWLATHAEEYHRRIESITEGGSVEEWIRFFARCVREQAEEQLRLIEELETLQVQMLGRAQFSPRGREVVSGLITAPVATNQALQVRYGFSSRTASEITGQLVDAGIVHVRGKKANKRIFVCDPVLDLYTIRTPLGPASDSALFHPSPDR